MIFNVLVQMIHLVQHNIWLVYYYNLDMLNVAINRHFYSGGVKSVVCSPGLVLTRTSPAALRYGELILCFMEYLNIIYRFFIPSIRLFGSRGAAVHCELIDSLPNGLNYKYKYMMKFDELGVCDEGEDIDTKETEKLYQVFYYYLQYLLQIYTVVYEIYHNHRMSDIYSNYDLKEQMFPASRKSNLSI